MAENDLGGERARNTRRFRWAGNPEAWGSEQSFVAPARLSTFTTSEDTPSKQIIRAETEDLVSLAWDLTANWTVTGLTHFDRGTLALEVTLGTGHNTAKFYWVLASIESGVVWPQNAGAQQFGWEPSPDGATPYNGIQVVAASGTVGLLPAVPPGFRLHATAFTAAGSRALTALFSDNVIPLSSQWDIAIPAGGGSVAGPLDWWPGPGTPTVTTTFAAGAGPMSAQFSVQGMLYPQASQGVAISASPVIATAINARAVLRMRPAGETPHDINVRVAAQCAPRSWVP